MFEEWHRRSHQSQPQGESVNDEGLRAMTTIRVFPIGGR